MPLDPNKPPIDVEEHCDTPDHETAEARSNYTTLTDMSQELEFFTPALLNLGGFDRDPVVEYFKLRNLSDASAAFAIDYQQPFFQGLGVGRLLGRVVAWDHRLYAIRRDLWDDFRDTVAGIAWVDQRRWTYTRCGFHELEIVDPTLLYARGEILSQLPYLTITVFATSSNRAFSFLAPAEHPPLTLPFLVQAEPKADLVVEADRVLGPPLSPETLSRNRTPQ